jgi:hypothetical protein
MKINVNTNRHTDRDEGTRTYLCHRYLAVKPTVKLAFGAYFVIVSL